MAAELVPVPIPEYHPQMAIPHHLPLQHPHRKLVALYNQLITKVNHYLTEEAFVKAFSGPYIGETFRGVRAAVASYQYKVVVSLSKVFVDDDGVLDPVIRPPLRLSGEVARILGRPRLLKSTADTLQASLTIKMNEAEMRRSYAEAFPADAAAAAAAVQAQEEADTTRQMKDLADAAALEEENAALDPVNIAFQQEEAVALQAGRIARRNLEFHNLTGQAQPVRRREPRVPRVGLRSGRASPLLSVLSGLRDDLGPAAGGGGGRGRGRGGLGDALRGGRGRGRGGRIPWHY